MTQKMQKENTDKQEIEQLVRQYKSQKPLIKPFCYTMACSTVIVVLLSRFFELNYIWRLGAFCIIAVVLWKQFRPIPKSDTHKRVAHYLKNANIDLPEFHLLGSRILDDTMGFNGPSTRKEEFLISFDNPPHEQQNVLKGSYTEELETIYIEVLFYENNIAKIIGEYIVSDQLYLDLEGVCHILFVTLSFDATINATRIIHIT